MTYLPIYLLPKTIRGDVGGDERHYAVPKTPHITPTAPYVQEGF